MASSTTKKQARRIQQMLGCSYVVAQSKLAAGEHRTFDLHLAVSDVPGLTAAPLRLEVLMRELPDGVDLWWLMGDRYDGLIHMFEASPQGGREWNDAVAHPFESLAEATVVLNALRALGEQAEVLSDRGVWAAGGTYEARPPMWWVVSQTNPTSVEETYRRDQRLLALTVNEEQAYPLALQHQRTRSDMDDLGTPEVGRFVSPVLGAIESMDQSFGEGTIQWHPTPLGVALVLAEARAHGHEAHAVDDVMSELPFAAWTSQPWESLMFPRYEPRSSADVPVWAAPHSLNQLVIDEAASSGTVRLSFGSAVDAAVVRGTLLAHGLAVSHLMRAGAGSQARYQLDAPSSVRARLAAEGVRKTQVVRQGVEPSPERASNVGERGWNVD